MSENRHDFYEFFAGGGLVRLGLRPRWACTFANDICAKKATSYRRHFRDSPDVFVCDDVANLRSTDLPGDPEMAWASFPCQDLSLAGNREGLDADRSGTFWPFWRLMRERADSGRAIPLIVLENVVGAVTSSSGKDFAALLQALSQGGYAYGPLIMDAVRFVPQSRPRLFVIAVARGLEVPDELTSERADSPWHGKLLDRAFNGLPSPLKEGWIWWRLPEPPKLTMTLSDLVLDDPHDVPWHSPEETERLLSMMSDLNRAKVAKAIALNRPIVGTVYRRTRRDQRGRSVQRAEVRFDQVSGCLRTPAGGSSRQLILVVKGRSVRSRLLSSREAARLMGVSDDYVLPTGYNEAYHLMGDGVVVPVVRWLDDHLLTPLAESAGALAATA